MVKTQTPKLYVTVFGLDFDESEYAVLIGVFTSYEKAREAGEEYAREQGYKVAETRRLEESTVLVLDDGEHFVKIVPVEPDKPVVKTIREQAGGREYVSREGITLTSLEKDYLYI